MQEKQYRIPDLKKQARRSYSRMGFALLVMFCMTAVLQTVLGSVVGILCPAMMQTGWYIWALSVLPLYLVGFPLSMIFFLQEEPYRATKKTLSPAEWLGILTVCIFWLYIGNFLGSMAGSFFKGNSEIKDIIGQITGNSDIWANLAATVIVAPIMEELVTRKLLIDRIRRYGDMPACIFSGLMFGLMHGNFQQFFYAFFLGVIFAFVYAKTGRVIYTILLHAVINFLGGILPLLILSEYPSESIQISKLEDLGDLLSHLQPELVEVGIYYLCIFSLALIGLVLMLFCRKKWIPKRKGSDMPKNRVLKIAYLNPGVIYFIIYSIGMFILSLIFY